MARKTTAQLIQDRAKAAREKVKRGETLTEGERKALLAGAAVQAKANPPAEPTAPVPPETNENEGKMAETEPKTNGIVDVPLTKEEKDAAIRQGAYDAQMAWLKENMGNATGPAPAEPVKSFENPPEDTFEGFDTNMPGPEFDVILVQVTDDDVKAGKNKVFDLRRDGYVVDKVLLDGHIVRMKAPIEHKRKLNADRWAEYQRFLLGPAEKAKSKIKDPNVKGVDFTTGVDPTEGPAVPLRAENLVELTGHE
jgi:hypothetical protein